MKKIYKYSSKKFLSFDEDKQLTIIYEILLEILKKWDLKAEKEELLESLGNCISYNLSIGDKLSLPEILEKHSLNSMLLNLERILDINLTDKNILESDDYRIEKYDGKSQLQPPLPVTVLLDDLRSSFNVGSFFRTAECLRIEQLILGGYTPSGDNKKVLETSMGTVKYQNWKQVINTTDEIQRLKEQGYHIYALETTTDAVDLYDCSFQFPLVLLFGNEALGLDNEILKCADSIVKIPVRGWKNSLNVANSFAIVGYEILRQFTKVDPANPSRV